MTEIEQVSNNVYWIHKEVGGLDTFEKSLIAIEYFAKNLQRHAYSPEQKIELAEYFAKKLG